MRKLGLLCLIASICMVSPAQARESVALEIATTCSVLLAGAGFIGNFIMAIMTATAFHRPSQGEDADKYTKASGLNGGSVVANAAAAISGGIFLSTTTDPLRARVTARVALPISIVMTAGASVMSGFAAQSLDSVTSTTDGEYPRKEAHSFAIANYVAVAIAGVAFVSFVTAGALAIASL